MRTNGKPPMNETLPARVRRLRLAAGLSQRELAEPGVTYAYISRIEAGTRAPSAKALRKIAPKLGVTPNYLEFGSETDPALRSAERKIAKLTKQVDALERQLAAERQKVAGLRLALREEVAR